MAKPSAATTKEFASMAAPDEAPFPANDDSPTRWGAIMAFRWAGGTEGTGQRRYRNAFAMLVVLVVPGAIPGLALFAVLRSMAARRSRARGRSSAAAQEPLVA